MPQVKVQVFLLKHNVDVRTVSFLAAAQLYQPGSAHSLPAEAPQGRGLYGLSHAGVWITPHSRAKQILHRGHLA